ncbi:MAG: glycosyltransferase [Planctomycetes bacterium]|nr:glycosyltransferase [Planctomycetota bacterium]
MAESVPLSGFGPTGGEIPARARAPLGPGIETSGSAFSRNIEAINERDPDLAADLLRYRPPGGVSLVPLPQGEWALWDETTRLFRSSPNHPTASARALARGIWREIRGLSAIALGRIGAGYEIREVLRVQEAEGARSPVLYVLARDLLGVDAAFRLHDLSAAISEGRLVIFAGLRGLRRYAARFADGSLPLPRRRLRVFAERPGPWDRALATVHRALRREVEEHERQWAHAVGCGYARFDPRCLSGRCRGRVARAIVLGGWGRAAERAEAVACGLEGAGVGTILLVDGADRLGVTPCALAREIERFRPDFVVGIDRFRPGIIARADRLPYIAWCAEPSRPDGFVFSSPTDFAVAESAAQAAGLIARGFLEENVLLLPPATDPRRLLPPGDEEKAADGARIAMIEDLDPPGQPAGEAPETAERVASWIADGLPGVRIDLWGENWWTRPALRRFARGEAPCGSHLSRVTSSAGILVRARPEIDGSLLDAIAAGAFVMIHSPSGTDAIRDAFRDPEEVIFFGDGRELAARARYYLAHPEERKRARDRARHRILEEWTIDRRCRQLLAEVTARLRTERERAPREPALSTG